MNWLRGKSFPLGRLLAEVLCPRCLWRNGFKMDEGLAVLWMDGKVCACCGMPREKGDACRLVVMESPLWTLAVEVETEEVS